MRKAQSMVEYTILIIIVIAALITMQAYIKRGFQGRWKSSVDELGEQFDTNAFTSNLRYTISTNSHTSISVVDMPNQGVNGTYTYRTDTASSDEKKTGTSHVEKGY